ncbi:nicotinate-nucleotide adenylyltransferase [Desulforamulus hydrothermalis]|uniref:Probable nicotinate-nucleotide adenylyltransferase n=1 Tax=Desulforamulus hydrothermalis Lam5 = DSM 18033 TaxID=1121428 RepID=K8DYH1_9FIRM|nr:nicotinate-nucleotide adenylyltransferase [Desulforamulus hydrothermalis]CCO07907.1 putative nicotinate-nucleotide adenylyltransferase [Desulforamulus hydrothermalis Lam5 = DSM 18033]SHH34836.1 nicotinate-nucleotide adenylyltransferase [Desulforamulus hydrothermalis Lam5 = DSM 18033]
MQKICLMGGTFDPIHYGHLVVAEEVRQKFNLPKVLFIPAARPPHKTDQDITDATHRVNMVRLAVASNPYFAVSTLEVARQGLSYTIDTVRQIKQLYQTEKIYFITGADAVLQIINWKEAAQLLSMCTFIAATRPGYNLNNLQSSLASLPQDIIERILPLEVPALSISSSDIRQRVREGRSIKYLLPEAVEAYIFKNRLYTCHN